MDYRKYLYWYKPDQPSFEEDLVYREMYCRIGYIFHIIQMIEYNIAMILSIEEWEKEKDAVFTMEKFDEVKKKIAKRFKVLSSKKYTFGTLAREVENSVYLRDLDKKALKEVVEYRNYLAHKCFKEKLLNGSLKTIEDADRFAMELTVFEGKAAPLNNYLVSILNKRGTVDLSLLKTPNSEA